MCGPAFNNFQGSPGAVAEERPVVVDVFEGGFQRKRHVTRIETRGRGFLVRNSRLVDWLAVGATAGGSSAEVAATLFADSGARSAAGRLPG
jgi:hypothetical protein